MEIMTVADILTKMGTPQLIPIHEFFGHPYTIHIVDKENWKTKRRRILSEYEHQISTAENKNIVLINGYLCFIYAYSILVIKREEISDDELKALKTSFIEEP